MTGRRGPGAAADSPSPSPSPSAAAGRKPRVSFSAAGAPPRRRNHHHHHHDRDHDHHHRHHHGNARAEPAAANELLLAALARAVADHPALLDVPAAPAPGAAAGRRKSGLVAFRKMSLRVLAAADGEGDDDGAGGGDDDEDEQKGGKEGDDGGGGKEEEGPARAAGGAALAEEPEEEKDEQLRHRGGVAESAADADAAAARAPPPFSPPAPGTRPRKQLDRILRDISSASPATDAYLSRLASSPLAALLAEPAALAAEARNLDAARSELAFAHYHSFLHTDAAAAALAASLDSLSLRLDSLSAGRADDFRRAADRFLESARALADDRRKASCLRSQYDVLVDLLELPELVAACVRSNRYAEAMDLAGHVKRLAARYPDVEVIRCVAADTEKERARMLGALLRQLGEETKLPGALRVIGYLRRGEALEEGERGLRMAFLKNRCANLRRALSETRAAGGEPALQRSYRSRRPSSTAAAAGAGDAAGDRAAQVLRRRVDVVREHLFDVVTQYRALFSDAGAGGGAYLTSHGYGATSTPPNPPADPSSGPPPPPPQGPAPADEAAALLVSHVGYVLETQLVAPLREALARVTDPSTLATLLTQTMYCGMSLGRAGIDFRKIVAPHFEDAALRIAAAAVRAGAGGFAREVEAAAAALPDVRRSVGMLAAAGAGAPPRSTGAAATFAPPAHLVGYPPIARLCNAFLAAFNGLRAFAPVAVLRDLVRETDAALASAAGVLRRWAELAEEAAASAGEPVHPLVPAVVQALTATLAPYVRRCLVEGVYGSVHRSVVSRAAAAGDADGGEPAGTTPEEEEEAAGTAEDEEAEAEAEEDEEDEEEEEPPEGEAEAEREEPPTPPPPPGPEREEKRPAAVAEEGPPEAAVREEGRKGGSGGEEEREEEEEEAAAAGPQGGAASPEAGREGGSSRPGEEPDGA